NATQVVNIEGDDITFQSIPIARGWNIIGSVSSPVPVASLSTQPPGLITSGVFGYSGGYQGATTIQPGKGYWIRASDPGTLQLQGSENASLTVPAVPGSGGLTLTFGDDFGDSQTLSVSGDRNAANTLLTELPPTPPSGAFDVRFATGTITVLAPAPSDGPVTYPIAVQSVGGNLTVSISGLIDGSVAILSGPDGREIASSRGGPTSARLAGVRDLTLSLVSDILPQAYRLEQNYPNPFNPTTSIALDLPVDSRVSLRVYNALGQLVGNLVDEIRIAGHHTVVWNAGNAASGVYFVRFQADPVEEAGRGYLRNMKMLLVR
ncbi:MAG TPA: T9SS type A sorting domain-containing protein, partial [Bacteroidota bacterium]|nr:T9SS type A sorting domain-containing protein [Bacteroidota bacterium]